MLAFWGVMGRRASGLAAIGRVVECLPTIALAQARRAGLKGFTARNLRNMRTFILAFPIWHALRTELRLLEKGQPARDQLPTGGTLGNFGDVVDYVE